MKQRMPFGGGRRARGVTLIEVLVTMVIVAVGLLGLAGMQVRGLSIQKDAHGRALATQLALDIADRMRSNTGALASYTFTTPYPTGAYTVPAGPDCVSGACTAVQQAQFDFSEWFTRVQGGALPGGWARIEQDAASPAWKITLMWAETGFRADPTVRAALGSSCPPETAPTPPEVECITLRVQP
ncbi:MAG TPA: type IV pilus modification protein PilV [Burkholderiaceae bacterium]|nr:type IV pilus modification protein PilV [Burkholderiaceae bacterium]